MSKRNGHAPYRKIKGALRENGLNYDRAAEALGMSVAALTHKINGPSDFYISEVMALSKLTGYSITELMQEGKVGE